jgi:hypothetical protein
MCCNLCTHSVATQVEKEKEELNKQYIALWQQSKGAPLSAATPSAHAKCTRWPAASPRRCDCAAALLSSPLLSVPFDRCTAHCAAAAAAADDERHVLQQRLKELGDQARTLCVHCVPQQTYSVQQSLVQVGI